MTKLFCSAVGGTSASFFFSNSFLSTALS
jgi:hypothetical protein